MAAAAAAVVLDMTRHFACKDTSVNSGNVNSPTTQMKLTLHVLLQVKFHKTYWLIKTHQHLEGVVKIVTKKFQITYFRALARPVSESL